MVQGNVEPDEEPLMSELKKNGYDSCEAPSNICSGNDYIVYDTRQIEIVGVDQYVDTGNGHRKM